MLETVRKLLLKRSRLELYGRGLGPLKGGEKGSEIKIWKTKIQLQPPFLALIFSHRTEIYFLVIIFKMDPDININLGVLIHSVMSGIQKSLSNLS